MLELPLCIFAETEDFPFYIQYGFHDKECEMHGHEDFSELVIVMEGYATHVVESEQYAISKGDVFVLDRYTHHRYINAESFRICNIMFRPEEMFHSGYHIRQNPGFQALFVLEPYYAQNNRFCSRLRLDSEDYARVMHLVSEIMQEHTRRQDSWQTLVYARFIQLCVMLSRLYQQYDEGADSAILKLAAAVAHIERNYCSAISISELAQISGYSERQFSRLFKSAFSLTPNHYITNLRIQKAQQLLQNTAQPIGEISWSCGYDDQNYFSRTFRKAVGSTPHRVPPEPHGEGEVNSTALIKGKE